MKFPLKFRYDPNDDNDDEKFNVVRETAEEELFGPTPADSEVWQRSSVIEGARIARGESSSSAQPRVGLASHRRGAHGMRMAQVKSVKRLKGR